MATVDTFSQVVVVRGAQDTKHLNSTTPQRTTISAIIKWQLIILGSCRILPPPRRIANAIWENKWKGEEQKG